MEQEACCTCATLLSAVPRSRLPPLPPTAEQAEKPPLFDPDHEGSEKPPLPDPNHDEKSSLREHQNNRRLPCCSRVICAACLVQNHRYHSYCPYCQVSSSDPPPSYPHHDPPPYSPLPQKQQPATAATAATDASMAPSDPEKAGAGRLPDDVGGEDTLHFLDHANDSVASLSLRYGVPVGVLRRVNNLPSDHLLAARRTLLIPGTHYRGGVSLSPRPVEGEAEEARKAKIRRFMVTCKASEYDVAVFYLEQAGYDFSAAVETFFADEAWEREHPLAEGADRRSRGRGKGTVGGGGGWFARKPK